MTKEERINKYIKEHCKGCKNKKDKLCRITISQIDNKAKCDAYEKE